MLHKLTTHKKQRKNGNYFAEVQIKCKSNSRHADHSLILGKQMTRETKIFPFLIDFLISEEKLMKSFYLDDFAVIEK